MNVAKYLTWSVLQCIIELNNHKNKVRLNMNVLLNLLSSSGITLDAPTIIAILVGCVLLSLCFTIPFSKKTTASALRLATDTVSAS